MNMTNQELIKKAVITTENLVQGGGLLSPKQSERFFNLVIDITRLRGMVRIERFRNDQMEIDKINTGNRVALPQIEATATSVRRGVKTSKISLQPQRVVTPFSISNDFLMENIQGESAEDLVINMMASSLANNLEELYLHGSLLGHAVREGDIIDGGDPNKVVKDKFLALGDGWLKRSGSAHIVDAQGANVSSNLFSKMIKEMPDKWKRDRRELRFFSSTDHEQNYRQTVSGRATASGDVALSTTQNLTPFGIELVPVPLLFTQPPVVQHVQLNGTTAVQLGGFINITDVIVTPVTLDSAPTDPFIDTTDYIVDQAAGTIARTGGGAIGDGDTVKVTFRSLGQSMLTGRRNLILGIGREIQIKRDEDIYSDVREYAIHTKVAVQIQEEDAAVLAINVGLD